MRYVIVRAAFAAVILAVSGGGRALVAQDRPQPRDREQRAEAARRDSLEVRVRDRMGQMLTTQLGLSDDQVRRLQATNRQFEGQRRALFAEERNARMRLREELQRGDSTRQAEVATLLDGMMQVQRKRLDLIEAEQKELATFLTPVQRARLFGMEEQIRQRMMEMRDRRAPGMQAAPGRRPPVGRQPPGGVRRPQPRP
ncbi:MAG: hypothetical protein WD771_03140 [Gemmatimonadaceae bacterium]